MAAVKEVIVIKILGKVLALSTVEATKLHSNVVATLGVRPARAGLSMSSLFQL